MRNWRIGLGAMAVAHLFAPASWAGQMIDATDPAGILAIARNHGDAELTKDSMGDPLITGQIGGKDYKLFFYDCSNNRDCETVMFRAVWQAEDVTDAMMAEWNRDQRFGKAYLVEEGNAALEMNVNLRGGVSKANLDDTIDWWRLVLDAFAGDFDL